MEIVPCLCRRYYQNSRTRRLDRVKCRCSDELALTERHDNAIMCTIIATTNAIAIYEILNRPGHQFHLCSPQKLARDSMCDTFDMHLNNGLRMKTFFLYHILSFYYNAASMHNLYFTIFILIN